MRSFKLQSTNEELTIVNDQYQHRNEELDEFANDLVNVLSSVDIPVIIVDMDLRVRRFTPAVRSIASLIPDDVGRRFNDLKLKVEVHDIADRIHGVMESLSPREWEVQGEDGSWFRLQIRPYRTWDDRLNGAVILFVNVDALKRAIQNAEHARDYAKSIVETVSAALVVLDSELHVVSANEAFYKKFKLSTKVAKGRSLAELSRELWEKSSLRKSLDEAVVEKKPFSGLEISAKFPGLGHRFFSLGGRPILWGQVASMVLLTIDDITDLRTLEAERAQLLESERQARVEAERSTHAKDLFLATLSHELRTPLSSMLMFAQLLKRIASDDSRIERASDAIERAANAQARLIDDLLDVSRIVSGKLMLNLGPVDLGEVVREAVDIAQRAALAKALELDIQIDDFKQMVYGDQVRLLQVVNNLLNNAIKFTPHGGHVWVRLERIDERAQLTIVDTGMGISADVSPQLFTRFIQADSSVTRTYGGLGLGLSIVRYLVEVHGGEVQAESPGVGKGSTFRVTLPLGTADQTPAEGESRTVVRSIKGVRVLLVEDDDDTREAYATMLAELGVHVRAERSAAAGLSALGEFQPDVIISDIAMPGEDGNRFIEKVRRLEVEQGRPKVPAAALTALASDEDRQRVIQSGFQVHVAKPIDLARLASLIGMLIDL